MTALPRYVSRERSRHGTERLYYRRGGKRMRLRAAPGTDAFQTEIEKAAAELTKPPVERDLSAAPSYVYFIVLDSKKVKIGFARDPRRRLKELKAGMPGKTVLYYATSGDRAREVELHKLFFEERLSGEWFIFSRRIKDWIAADERRRLEAIP